MSYLCLTADYGLFPAIKSKREGMHVLIIFLQTKTKNAARVVCLSVISEHDLIMLGLTKSVNKGYLDRTFRKRDKEAIRKEVLQVDWLQRVQDLDLNQKVTHFSIILRPELRLDFSGVCNIGTVCLLSPKSTRLSRAA